MNGEPQLPEERQPCLLYNVTHCTRGVLGMHMHLHTTHFHTVHTHLTHHTLLTHTLPTHTHTLPPSSPPSITQTHTQHLNEQIAHLKDQLQELKAKTNLEAKYVKKETQVGTILSKVHCLQSNFTLCKYPNSMVEYVRVGWSMVECGRVW